MFSCSCGMIQAWSSFSDVWFIAFWCCTSRGKDEVQEFTWESTRSKIYWIITCANSYLQTSFNYLPQINWPLIMLDCHIRKCWELPFWGLKWNFNPGFRSLRNQAPKRKQRNPRLSARKWWTMVPGWSPRHDSTRRLWCQGPGKVPADFCSPEI